MIKNKFIISKPLLCILLIIASFSLFNLRTSLTATAGPSYTPHSPFSILSDSDFISLGFPGSGTVNDPYVIEGYNITTTISSYAIQVRSTTAHFVIRNCFLKSKYTPIMIQEIAANTSTVADNYIVDSHQGIYLRYAFGIKIENNTIINNNYGIFSLSNYNERIVNNTIKNSLYYGFYESEGTNLFLANNTFVNCGLYFSANSLTKYRTYTLQNNSVNNLPILYLVDVENYHLNQSDYGQILLINCTNALIENQNLSKTSIGIYGYYSSNLSIESSIFSELFYSLNFRNCINVTISNISSYNSGQYGIAATFSYGISISNSSISNQNFGCYFRNDDNLSIVNSTFTNLWVNGLYTYTCDGIFVNNNLFNNVTKGVSIYNSNNTIIDNNHFIDSKNGGISLSGNDFITVTNNQLDNCGIKLNTYNYFHTFLENNFVNNLPLGYFVNISNQVIDTPYGQLIVAHSDKITILNQYMTNIPTGLELVHCSNIDLKNITIYQASEQGIYVDDSHHLSFTEIFINKTTNDCFYVISSSYLYINQSRFSYASYSGVFFEQVSNSTISYNIFNNNGDFGVYLYDSENTVVFGNDFLFNEYSQAYDESPRNNSWFSPDLMRGNCWSDWNGSTTYAIETDSGYTFDLYPTNDTDKDSLNDSNEVFLYGTNPFLADSDEDGLKDNEELGIYFTDPLLKDSDGDGMPDGWEVQYGLNPLVNDAAEDSDNDNLSNLEEWNYQTNPASNDTENDGMPDGWEVQYGLNPLVNDSIGDPDNDSLTNIQEFHYGTNPLIADTDGDGYTDGEEIEAGTDPLNKDDYPLPTKTNLGLILGLSIAGVVIVSVGITFYVLKRKGFLAKILSKFK